MIMSGNSKWERFCIMNVYEEYIRGRTIAIVGPAKYMEGSGKGDEIDSHDIVVRINRGIETSKQIPLDVGTRTDILWSCLIEKPGNAGNIDIEVLKKEGVKFICCPPASSFQGISKETRFHDLVDEKKILEISRTIPVRICDAKFHTELAMKISSRPNTGFLSIYDFLRFEIGKLSIYGFSFYLDGFVSGVKEGIMEEQSITEEQYREKCFSSKRHNQENMWNHAKKTLPTNDVVCLDNVLSGILHMKSFDFKEYNKIG